MRSPLLAILFALGFVVAAVCGFATRTAPGVQCPTAPVQAVVVRDCCGRIVARAPKPGERNFVQCRCAEKKTASQRAVVSGGKVEIVAPRPFAFEAPASLRAAWARPGYAAREAAWSVPPPTRPPVVS